MLLIKFFQTLARPIMFESDSIFFSYNFHLYRIKGVFGKMERKIKGMRHKSLRLRKIERMGRFSPFVVWYKEK